MDLIIEGHNYSTELLDSVDFVSSKIFLNDSEKVKETFEHIFSIFLKNPVKVFNWMENMSSFINFSNLSKLDLLILKATFKDFYRDTYKENKCEYTNFYFSLFSSKLFDSK